VYVPESHVIESAVMQALMTFGLHPRRKTLMSMKYPLSIRQLLYTPDNFCTVPVGQGVQTLGLDGTMAKPIFPVPQAVHCDW
jgi:hypothetical protein